ncbi:MAG: ABC transporter ATP-binding protein/permease [Aquificaceae bacterium]|nr:ABC transporter ATP-binding protein/permease [Aquificaceae bacterium]
MEHIRWILERLRVYWHFILLSLIGSLLDGAGTAGVSLLIKSLVDKVFLLKEVEELLQVVLMLMGFVLLAQVGRLATAFFSNLYTELEMKKLREEAFRRLLTADYSTFMGVSPGEFASRTISDMNLYRNLIGFYLIKLIREPVSVLFLVGVLVYRDWLFTLSLLVLLPFLAFAVKYFGSKRGKHIKRAQEGYAGVADRLYSSFSGFESIRSFRAGKAFERFFESLNRTLFRSSIRSELYFALNSFFNFTFGYLVVAIVILYGGYRIAEGALTPGDFLSYLTALVFLQTPLMESQKGFMEVRANLPVVARIREVLSLKQEDPGELTFHSSKSDIVVENLRVELKGQCLLKDLSFKVSKGEKIGIMGDTGSGKSTLLRVMAGLLPYQGSIKLDGLELRDIKRENLRESFLFLSQEPFVFPGTVRENLLIVGQRNDDELWEALRFASCDFVKSLDEQVNPKSLSGGERQRLALARLFLKPSDVLLLDEITSALDARTEEEVLRNLFERFKDRTFILVAHRFSNLLRCDRVFVMKNQSIVFEGKPKEAIDFFLQSP